jgi:N-acetylglucosaminyl-diphospho-decaprenol L-rhamnosyltransferase
LLVTTVPDPGLLPAKPPEQKRPTVSVCIVNWNCKDMLRNCLRSLRSSRQGVRVEVIVVDNASADGAADMVRSEFPHVKLIRNRDNAGFARGNNQAARVARGRYLFFLNNDTLAPRGTLKRLIRYARTQPNLGLLGPRLIDGRGRTQLSARRQPTVAALAHRLTLLRWTGLFRGAYRRYRGRDDQPDSTRPVSVLLGAALLMPRRIFRQVGGWDESYPFGAEDIDLCARVRRTHEVIYHPSVEIIHFGRVSSRQRIGFVHSSTVVGVTHSLRQTGTSRLALCAYKVAFTLDAPLQWLVAVGRYAWARLRGSDSGARRALLEMHGVGYFLTRGLPAFWKA